MRCCIALRVWRNFAVRRGPNRKWLAIAKVVPAGCFCSQSPTFSFLIGNRTPFFLHVISRNFEVHLILACPCPIHLPVTCCGRGIEAYWKVSTVYPCVLGSVSGVPERSWNCSMPRDRAGAAALSREAPNFPARVDHARARLAQPAARVPPAATRASAHTRPGPPATWTRGLRSGGHLSQQRMPTRVYRFSGCFSRVRRIAPDCPSFSLFPVHVAHAHSSPI